MLLPGRRDLVRFRLEYQRRLLLSGTTRLAPIQVTLEGVIFDGHHWVRAAAEEGKTVDVLVVDQSVQAMANSILVLPVR